MSTDQPPPPESPIPPPPTGTTASAPEIPGKSKDNPIAVAGLVVSLLALVLSIIVLGGFVAFIGFTLSMKGLQRSRTLETGRGLSIGGIALSVLALLASVGAFVVIMATINGGEERVVDGITTTSNNVQHPPQADIDDVVCGVSNGGGLPLATVQLENRSPGESLYAITIEWDTESGSAVSGIVRSEFLAAGESQTLRLFDQTGTGLSETCRVSRIERSGLGILPN